MAGGGTVLDGQWAPSAFALFMVQVAIILILSRFLTWALKVIKQPAVVAEMLAGIILGPTVLGRVPSFSANVFPPASTGIIQVISNFALIFFMFIVGLELDPAKLRADARIATAMSVCGIVLPFVGSCLLALLFKSEEYSNTSFINLTLFLTCALGMTALPVLARILSERRMLTTRVGSLALTVAAVDDIFAYCLLAITIAVIRSTSQMGVLWTILLTLAELAFMFLVVGPVIRWLVKRDSDHTHLNADTFLYLSIILVVCSYLAEIIGLSALIGAFQVGLLIPRSSNLSHHLSDKLEYFTVSILMPLYFTNSGLRTQLGLINDGTSVAYVVLVVVVATVCKVAGISLTALAYRVPCRISFTIGILMSCKGLVALIVVNFGLDTGAITSKFFAILVVMVVVTTMMTVPLVNLVDPPSRAEAAKLEVAAWEERMAAEAAAKAAAAATKAAAAARKAGVEAGAPLTAGGGGGEDGEGGGGTSTGVSVAPTAIVLSTGASTRVMRANSFRGTGADDISAPGSVSGASLQRSDSLRHRNLLAADGAEAPAVAGLASNAPVTTIVVPPSASSGAMSAGSGGRSGGVGGGEDGGGGGGGVLSDLRHSVSTRLRSGSMAVAHTLVAIVGGGRGRGGEDGEPTDAVMVEMPGDGSAAGSSDGPGPLASPAQRPPIIRRASSGFDAHASAPASPLARRASVEGTGFGGTGGSLAASAAAAAAAAAHGAHALAHLPLKVVLAIGETSAAQSLVSITNALADCDPLSATNATRPLSLTLTWLLESIDMPSSYMNFTDCVDDIRDTNLAAALGRCEQRNRLDIAAFPTHQPFHDACDEARQKHAHFLLCSMRFLRDSAGILPGNEDLGKLLAVAAVEARPCTTLLLFDFSKLFHVMRVLVPLTPDPHCADQALDFVQSLDSAVEVTMLHTVATPPEDADPAPVHAAAAAAAAAVAAGTGSATYASPPPRSGTLPRKQAGDSEVVGDDGATTAATTAVVALPVTVATTPAAGFMPPITPAAGGAAVGGVASPAAPTYAHSRLTRAFLPPDAAGAGAAEEGAPSASSLPPPPPPRRPVVDARRHAGGALPTVIEVPTVNSFSAMLAAATSADLEKFRAAVEAARLEREGGGAGAGAAGSGDGGAAGRGAAARGAGARPAAESRIAEEEHEGGSAEGEVEHDGSRRVSFADDMDAAAAGGSFSAGSPAYHRGRGTAGSTAGGAGSSVSAGGRFVPAAGGAGGEIEVSAGTDAILADRLRYMLSTRAACREVAASGGADIATATDFVLRHAPRPYDLVVVGADSTDFMRPGVSEAAAQNALLARLLPFLTVCRANHTSVMVVVSRSHHHHHHRASASGGGGGGSGSAAAH